MAALYICLVLLTVVIISEADETSYGPRFCPKLDKTIRLGNTLIGSSIEERACDCYQRCVDMTGCKVWVYYKKEGKQCELFLDATPPLWNTKTVTGLIDRPCELSDTKDRPEGDMGHGRFVDEPCDCHDFCVDFDGCKAWAWNKRTRWCRLKNVVNDAVYKKTHVSGVV
uniref:Uncharacterized protein LOC102810362 n=1 Tax=Saccoglossus kowalevskii TaxID=10224 RepID=A0ABM0MS00_SACKO|nr:PREDICTED: uncharacterized protein LOC102810362 [Saccoglossus kowalevskii]